MHSPAEVTSYKVGAWVARSIETAGPHEYRHRTGYVATQDGIVGVYVQHDLTSLCFVHGGREYRARWLRHFQDRALVTQAKRFAAAVVAGDYDGGRRVD